MNNEEYINQIKKDAENMTNGNVNWDVYKHDNILSTPKDNTNEQHDCTRCGECCEYCIPYSEKELTQIKEYVKKHDIKPEPDRLMTYKKDGFNGMKPKCCFYNEKERKCNIYEVRPAICRAYKCDDTNWIRNHSKKYNANAKYNKTLKGKKAMQNYLPFDESIYGDKQLPAQYIQGMTTMVMLSNNINMNFLNYINILRENFKAFNRMDLCDYVNIPISENKVISLSEAIIYCEMMLQQGGEK